MQSNQIIPVFPLPLVVYPNEILKLHIFEERYKELIHDCEHDGISFCIASNIRDSIQKIGAIVSLKKIFKKYDDGRCDISIECVDLCLIEGYLPNFTNKKYSAVEIQILHRNIVNNTSSHEILQRSFTELCYINSVKPHHDINWIEFNSYMIGHLVGFNLQEEYHFLSLESESERLDALQLQIDKLITQSRQRNEWITRLNLNGEFRKF